MNVERDEARALYKVSSPDRRVWAYVSDLFHLAGGEPAEVLIERTLLKAREDGVNGRVMLTVTRKQEPGDAVAEYTMTYEPVPE
jgi:hypothetical protein